MPSQPEFAIELALDDAEYEVSADAVLSAHLNIRNSTTDPETLTFATGQVYDLEIRDDQGSVVYLWSKGKVFPQVVTTVQVQYEKEFALTAPLAHLRPGKYVVKAWLLLEGPPRAYSASARFTIT
jgi:intracellular proteinase inhibitor BsuPI